MKVFKDTNDLEETDVKAIYEMKRLMELKDDLSMMTLIRLLLSMFLFFFSCSVSSTNEEP